ncbi:protein-tyrosine kinase [Massilia sp. UYP32]|uniref:non-specific protein-tyrosine kinase n=1 Tax=Massilia timonae CCUG 45783 TaxID=883126 RepID=K9DZF4_9BURK|nr:MULTISPECIES: XrtA-associated tyrosine autokinase [Massilia]EKU84002.1 exopolysaccharide/pepcterm locus tyrosine autokinase [Massilia timonae CCUG 45783]QYG00481.1 XrtA-associated tyrosine autokinase [Massilia sp. NP310]HAK91945.1 chromosome partitioning ATPase [Massilia timonae]
MSIIEKAASRIDQQRQNAAPVNPAASIVPAEPPLVEAPAAVLVDVPVAPAPTPDLAAEAAPAPARTRRVELDLGRMRELGMVTAAGGRTNLLEEFRIIKRPLLKRAFAERGPKDNPANLIMITSSLPGEGKTYCAINLAMSIAMELDHTVLLVDADVARPSVLRTLGLPAQRGLMDILVDDTLQLPDVILRTNVDTLALLPAGATSNAATELLASSTMAAMLTELANRYPDRVIIFDSPPLMLTTEARVLASHMGQIVVVVEAQTTTQHAVKESLQQLEGMSNVNLVYNKTRDIPGIEETYDYHYG